MQLIHLVIALHFIFVASSSTSYQSIRALDETGQSIQLRHAQKAASLNGQLVLALTHPPSSNHDENAGDDDLDDSTLKTYVVATQPNQVHIIVPRHVFLACSGIQGDARWLRTTLRQLSQQIQLRYGPSAGQSNWAQRLSTICQGIFWGFADVPWHAARWLGKELLTTRWARPLGVASILVEDGALLASVDTSGTIFESQRVVAIGRGGLEIRKRMESLSLPSGSDGPKNHSLEDRLQEACKGILSSGTTLYVTPIDGDEKEWMVKIQ